MSMMPLGGASFEVVANTDDFARGMRQAQAQAQRTSQTIYAQFNRIEQASNNLAIVPRQLAAINQTIMATNNLLATMGRNATTASNALRGGGGFGNSFGSGVFAISQAVDDIQYGFQAIVNNVGQIGMGLGSAIGLAPPQAQAFAAALQVAAVAANQLYKHWDDMFGSGSKLPTIKDGLEGLAESLGKIKEQLDPLKKVADDIAEGNRGTFGQMADMMGFGEGSLKNRMKLEKLKEMEKTVKERLKDERLLEATGPEHTEQAQKTGAAVRKAVSKLPQGSESLVATLMARGMTLEEARKAATGAMRGNAGNLGDVLAKLTPEEKRGKFQGLAAATLEGQRHGDIMSQFEESERQASEAGMDQIKRDEAEIKHWRDEVDQIQKQLDREKKQKRDAEIRREQSDLNRMLRQDIEGPEKRRRNRHEGGFVGFAEFAKEIQAGALSSHQEKMEKIAADQLKALNEIREKVAESPALQAGIGALGVAALAGGPN